MDVCGVRDNAKGGEEDEGQDSEQRPTEPRTRNGSLPSSTRVHICPTCLLSRGIPCMVPRFCPAPTWNPIAWDRIAFPAWATRGNNRARRTRSAMWASWEAKCDDLGLRLWTRFHLTSTGRPLSPSPARHPSTVGTNFTNSHALLSPMLSNTTILLLFRRKR